MSTLQVRHQSAADAMSDVAPVLARSNPSRDWEMIVIALIVVVMAYLLCVRTDGRVAFRGFNGWVLPESCMSYSVFGVSCPGCGLTRSIIELSRGHFASSLHYHRLGWLMALAIVLQLPYRWLSLRLGRPPLGTMLPKAFGYSLIAGLVVNWLLRWLI
jgi:hypothetical protein